MPILEIIKAKVPNTIVKNATLSPPANIPEETSPIASIASKAVIIPIMEPKTPRTNPKRLTSDTKPIIFLNLAASLFKLKPDLIKKKTDSSKQIKIRDIKNGPPSLNLSTKTFPTKGICELNDNIFIIININ